MSWEFAFRAQGYFKDMNKMLKETDKYLSQLIGDVVRLRSANS